MQNLDFGIVVTIVGMGTTFVTLIFLGFVIDIMKKLFPVEEVAPEKKAAEMQKATDRA